MANDPYQDLGVAKTATDSEIRAAFRKLAKQYHPDRVQHLGAEFREMAEQKMQEINEAHQYFKSKFNELR